MKRETMRATGFRKYGPADVLETLEVARPVPAPGEVLVRVASAGVNPADAYLRGGRFRFVTRTKLPFVPGADVAGVVEAVGADVTRFEPGEAVYAMLPNLAGGGYAEYAVVDARDVARVPEGLTLGEAAAVPLAALTALKALRDGASLKDGERVLIHGASGGVGTFAVQIARAMGARVSGVASGRNAELVRSLGADEVFDYVHDDVAPGGARYDKLFGAVNVFPFRMWRRALHPGGVIVTVNPALGNAVARWISRVVGDVRLEGVLVRPSGPDLERIGAWISTGQIRPVIDRRYALSDAAEAHRYVETRRARGKLLLVVDERLAGQTAKRAHHAGTA